MKPLRPLLIAAFATACAASAWAETEQEETISAHVQSTYVWQSHRPFSAAYSGPNSLSPEKERSYTFTTTGFLGFRPWQDGEAYFTPELTQGVPFSNLTGLGGFTNGEITRASGSNPKIYRQKLFLRQTWNQGGDAVPVAPGQNQLAGVVSADRFVLTAGNFSTLDVFDRNAYAGDPRTQFMNWGNMTHTAYDYAADARGFGWGFAGEWYRGDWVLRFGRMTGPITPNAQPVDLALGHHYGDQVEVEHRHSLDGQPGKVRVLAWRNRAVTARFDDALAYGLAHPDNPDHQWILQVRNGEKIKYGLGMNLEQALSERVGVFARVMKADGRTETYAFTESDGSLSLGAALNGALWGRGQDTLGLAWVRNTLSPARRNYLAAGGISFFIGDGALRYRPESTFESYYSWQALDRLWITFDYQRVANPAYNADRGPVTVGSVRLHTEF